MPVKTLQKIRDQAILLGPRPSQTRDRHVLVVGHDDPMIVRLHFTPFSSFRRNQRYYPSSRSKNPVYVTFNNQSSKNRRCYSFYCEFYFLAWRFFSGEEKCQGVRMFICLEASPRLIKSGMTYGMTRVPTPTEFRICGRWRMLRRGITENNPSEVFPSVQVHVGGVSAVLQLDRYTLLDF